MLLHSHFQEQLHPGDENPQTSQQYKSLQWVFFEKKYPRAAESRKNIITI
jgi:hypothetical protein